VKTEIIRRAEARDSGALVALVGAAGLPLEGVMDGTGEYVVAERDGRLVGCYGIEVYGGDGLLRSVAVTGDERSRGLGARLVEHALSNARERGLRTVTLLTTSASGYFPRFGFREVGRDDTPEDVRASEEFRSVCPSTATVMVLRLESGATRMSG
jgi:amino-acid N-acetyltransferase